MEGWSQEFQQGEDEECYMAFPMVKPMEAALRLAYLLFTVF
jgi:hypothetical protein